MKKKYTNEERLDKLFGEIHQYCASEGGLRNINGLVLESNIKKVMQEEDSVLRQAYLGGALEDLYLPISCWAPSLLTSGQFDQAIELFNKGISYFTAGQKGGQEFSRLKGFPIRLSGIAESVLSVYCIAVIFEREEADWLAHESWLMLQDNSENGFNTWGEYLDSMLFVLANIQQNKQLAISNSFHNKLHPLAKKLSEAETAEAVQVVLMQCLDYRFEQAYRSVIRDPQDSWLHYDMCAIPLEILAFEKLYNGITGENLTLEHFSILPEFRALEDKGEPYHDEYMDILADLSKKLFE